MTAAVCLSAGPEAWVPIADYPGYEVSSQGRIRRSAPAKTRPAGAILSTRGLRAGYPSVDLCRAGSRRTFLVHRLVAAAFLGECPPRGEVNHKNGVKTDPRAENLEYATRSENQRHAYASGLQSAEGSLNGQAKLSEADVVAIREAKPGESELERFLLRRLARRFGVTPSAIHGVRSRRTWRHVP